MKNLTESILQHLRENVKTRETGMTSISGERSNQHQHRFDMDEKGNGKTIETLAITNCEVEDHAHDIKNNVIQDAADGHSHTFVSRNDMDFGKENN